MTPPIQPDHAPGVGWAIADLLARARATELAADVRAIKRRKVAA